MKTMDVIRDILVVALGAYLLVGCVAYKGAKVVEGTDLAVGMELPGTDGMAQLNILNYLSGFRLGLQKDAGLVMRYEVKSKTSFFGCLSTEEEKSIEAKVDAKKKEE